MSVSYKELTKEISDSINKIKPEIPDVITNFHQMAGAALKTKILDEKTKEYIALATAIAGRCNECIGFHVKALVRLGVTKEELSELLGVCIYMGGGPSLMYAAKTYQAFEEFSKS